MKTLYSAWHLVFRNNFLVILTFKEHKNQKIVHILLISWGGSIIYRSFPLVLRLWKSF